MLTALETGKKLKERLEELKVRAGTLDDALPSGNEKPSPPAETKRRPAPKTQRQSPPAQVKPTLQGQYTPPMHQEDEYLFQTSYDERERSNTPPILAYSTYPPPPEEMMMQSYGAVQGYQPMPTETYPEYLSPPPVMLPSTTNFSDAIKRETAYPGRSMDKAIPPCMSGYPTLGVDQGWIPDSEDSSPWRWEWWRVGLPRIVMARRPSNGPPRAKYGSIVAYVFLCPITNPLMPLRQACDGCRKRKIRCASENSAVTPGDIAEGRGPSPKHGGIAVPCTECRAAGKTCTYSAKSVPGGGVSATLLNRPQNPV